MGGGGNAAASLDGRGVWLLEQGRACTLREVGLDGRARRPSRRLPCASKIRSRSVLGMSARRMNSDTE